MCCLKLPSLTLPRLTMNLWSMASSSQSNAIHVWKGLHLHPSYEQHINLHTSGLYYVNIRAWTKIFEALHKKLKHKEGDKAFLSEAKLQLKTTLARFFSVSTSVYESLIGPKCLNILLRLFSAGIVSVSEKSIICSAGAFSSESAGFRDAGERGLMICDSVIAVFCMVDQLFWPEQVSSQPAQLDSFLFH